MLREGESGCSGSDTVAFAQDDAKKNRSVGFESLAGFEEGFQAGEDARPAVGAGGVTGIVIGPFVMRHGDFGGFGFGHEFDGGARNLVALGHSEVVLKDFGRLRAQDFAVNVGHWFAIGAWTDPCERAAGFEIGLKFSAGENDVVRFLRDEAVPDFFRRGGDVEDVFEWRLSHDCSSVWCDMLHLPARTSSNDR